MEGFDDLSREEANRKLIEWFDVKIDYLDFHERVIASCFEHENTLIAMACLIGEADQGPTIDAVIVPSKPDGRIDFLAVQAGIIKAEQEGRRIKGFCFMGEMWYTCVSSKEEIPERVGDHPDAEEGVMCLYVNRKIESMLGRAPIIAEVDEQGNVKRSVGDYTYFGEGKVEGRWYDEMIPRDWKN